MVIDKVKKVIFNKRDTNTSDLRKEIRKYKQLQKQISDEFEPLNKERKDSDTTDDVEGFGSKLASFIGQASINLEERQEEQEKKEKNIKGKNNLFDEIDSGKYF